MAGMNEPLSTASEFWRNTWIVLGLFVGYVFVQVWRGERDFWEILSNGKWIFAGFAPWATNRRRT